MSDPCEQNIDDNSHEKSNQGGSHFKRVRHPTDCVSRIAIVHAFPVEAQLVGGRDEKRFQELCAIGNHEYLRRDVKNSTCDWHRPTKSKHSIQVKGRNLGSMALVISEIGMVWTCRCFSGESHRFHQCSHTVREGEG